MIYKILHIPTGYYAEMDLTGDICCGAVMNNYSIENICKANCLCCILDINYIFKHIEEYIIEEIDDNI